MSTALRTIQSGETPEAEPQAVQPEIPEAARREQKTTPTEVSTPPRPKACRNAKAERDAQEQRIVVQRSQTLAWAEDRISRNRAAMARCVQDETCAIDAERVLALQESIGASEAAYSAAYEQIGVMEAELFSIDERIRSACGLPDR